MDPARRERKLLNPNHTGWLNRRLSGLHRQLIRNPVSLRLNAKRGIVAWLDAAGWLCIRD
jgi:hypothetical protein